MLINILMILISYLMHTLASVALINKGFIPVDKAITAVGFCL